MATESRVPVGRDGWVKYFRANFSRLVDNVGRGAAYTQTYATADRTHGARTATSAVVSAAVAASTSYWAFATLSQADALTTKLNQVIVDLDDTAQVVNALVDDLQAIGLIP